MKNNTNTCPTLLFFTQNMVELKQDNFKSIFSEEQIKKPFIHMNNQTLNPQTRKQIKTYLIQVQCPIQLLYIEIESDSYRYSDSV